MLTRFTTTQSYVHPMSVPRPYLIQSIAFTVRIQESWSESNVRSIKPRKRLGFGGVSGNTWVFDPEATGCFNAREGCAKKLASGESRFLPGCDMWSLVRREALRRFLTGCFAKFFARRETHFLTTWTGIFAEREARFLQGRHFNDSGRRAPCINTLIFSAESVGNVLLIKLMKLSVEAVIINWGSVIPDSFPSRP